MRTVTQAAELPAEDRPVFATLGVFDGVHRGHQAILARIVQQAQQQQGTALVITFDCHPNAVVAPEREPPMIYSVSQRLRALAGLGVDLTWLVHFDLAFSRQSAEEFIRDLTGRLRRLQGFAVGPEFTFGHRRSGNFERLRAWGQELGFHTETVMPVIFGQQPVSSTRIREAIRTGALEDAGAMLGRRYSLAAQVVAGDQRGRRLGFPTANLETAGHVLPPTGVYVVAVQVNTVSYHGMLNVGCRPTIEPGGTRIHVEAHLFDFSGDLYNREIEVSFFAKLREEIRFPSLEALRQQLENDARAARGWWAAANQPAAI